MMSMIGDPEPFIAIHVRRIAGSLLQMEPLGSASFQEGCDILRLVNRSTIPDEQDLAQNPRGNAYLYRSDIGFGVSNCIERIKHLHRHGHGRSIDILMEMSDRDGSGDQEDSRRSVQ